MLETSRGQILLWVVAAVLGTLALVRLLDGGAGTGSQAPALRVSRPAGTGAGAAGGKLYVHVAGAVRRPGLYRVPAAARVALALARAGGPARGAELAAVNLAAKLEDGQQVVVPRAGAGIAGTGPAGAATAGGKLSLASASVEQLDGLDGIGPTLAERIVEQREANGGFRSLEALREVEGIGEKRFAALKEALRP